VWQLREPGIADTTISEAVEGGRLHPVLHGVYCAGHRYLTPHGRLLAATLACGEGSVVSHGTAAWLYGLNQSRPDLVDVIAPIEAGRKIAGIRRRFVPLPSGREIWRRAGVPVTSPARTIVDCAGSDPLGIAAMIEQASDLRLLDIAAIDRVLDGPRRQGAKRLRRAIEPWRRYKPGIKIRSRMERSCCPCSPKRRFPFLRPMSGCA
jgi:predicted transcriptional regulator of viral defense system